MSSTRIGGQNGLGKWTLGSKQDRPKICKILFMGRAKLFSQEIILEHGLFMSRATRFHGPLSQECSFYSLFVSSRVFSWVELKYFLKSGFSATLEKTNLYICLLLHILKQQQSKTIRHRQVQSNLKHSCIFAKRLKKICNC